MLTYQLYEFASGTIRDLGLKNMFTLKSENTWYAYGLHLKQDGHLDGQSLPLDQAN